LDKKSYHNWLDNLQVGDEVFVSGGHYYGAILKIRRFTPTRMIGLSNGTTINKDGSIRGNNHFYIHPVTQKNRDDIERHRLYRKIKEVNFGRLSLEQLREIAIVTGIN
jgi:preprotein translocase subunit YajC